MWSWFNSSDRHWQRQSRTDLSLNLTENGSFFLGSIESCTVSLIIILKNNFLEKQMILIRRASDHTKKIFGTRIMKWTRHGSKINPDRKSLLGWKNSPRIISLRIMTISAITNKTTILIFINSRAFFSRVSGGGGDANSPLILQYLGWDLLDKTPDFLSSRQIRLDSSSNSTPNRFPDIRT